jgi:uncharacterized protein YraI
MLGRSSLVSNTLKAGLCVVALSVVAANWLSSGSNRSVLVQLATGTPPEPTTTGTLPEGVRHTRLDPCSTPARP